MNKFEEEIDAWKNLYVSGQIDEQTFLLEREKLLSKSQKIFEKEELKKNKKYKLEKLKLQESFMKIFLSIVFLILLILIVSTLIVNKPYEEISTLRYPTQPIQTPTTGGTTLPFMGTYITIDYLYEYDLYGRVVNTLDYIGYNLENQFSPKDITVSWGSLANEENNSQLNFYVPKPRFVSWRSSNQEWIRSMGNMINDQFSNNHLVPSSNKIKKLIKLIKEDDYIHIKGYLVKIKYTKNNNYYIWSSSTSRYDNGAGACETILVTDIKWLKEAK